MFKQNLLFAEKIYHHTVPKLFRALVQNKRVKRNAGGTKKCLVFVLDIQIQSPYIFRRGIREKLGNLFHWQTKYDFETEGCCFSADNRKTVGF